MGDMLPSDLAIARNLAPTLWLDRNEPFSIHKVFCTVFRWNGDSPSYPRRLTLDQNEHVAVEYAIAWDFDIGHAYELEHIWVYADSCGVPVRVEATAHGNFRAVTSEDHSLYVEPGKHGMGAAPSDLLSQSVLTHLCGRWAGIRGAYVPSMFLPFWDPPSASSWLDVEGHLQTLRFAPSFDWSASSVRIEDAELEPWDSMGSNWLRARFLRSLEESSGAPWRTRDVWSQTMPLEAIPSGVDAIEVRTDALPSDLLDRKGRWMTSGTELLVSTPDELGIPNVLRIIEFAYRSGVQNAVSVWADSHTLRALAAHLGRCDEIRLGLVGSSDGLYGHLPPYSRVFWSRPHWDADQAFAGPQTPLFNWVQR